ncbi:hypothetical protein [Rhodococcus sp. IEGM 1318]|uniref:hypothetical protein n=1 Tax=Rhodococcus sp. IEGM 1318 TaxID=3082226 RepID=UPI002955809B|nr:hypothetical protein [Rhodococcus sp. IEGM 1318]MDV8009516.1 hypothetical protein [Rhodococcus sp. IEGM 1318]
MTTTIEYVRFDTDNSAALAGERDNMVNVLRERYGADFIGAHLAQFDDGSLMDCLIWASPEAAARAGNEMPSDTNTQGFFSKIGHVHEMRHATVLHTA